MTDYARAHRLSQVTALAVLITLVGWWWSGTDVPLPQLVSGLADPVELQLFVTVALAPLTVWAFDEDVLRLEASSRRVPWVLDLLVVGALLGPACLIAAAVAVTGSGGHTGELVRNAAVFAGLALLCLGAAGRTVALVVPVAFFLVMACAGSRRDGSHPPWAFPADDASLGTSIAGWVLLACGFGVFAIRRRQVHGDAGPTSG